MMLSTSEDMVEESRKQVQANVTEKGTDFLLNCVKQA